MSLLNQTNLTKEKQQTVEAKVTEVAQDRNISRQQAIRVIARQESQDR